MNNVVMQFGSKPHGKFSDRPGAYVVVYNKLGEILALDVNGETHLPGGGIDQNEEPKSTAIRETSDESGCEIANIQYLGEANQFFPSSKIGPLNKLGIFYTAQLKAIDEEKSAEADHRVIWLKPKDFIESNASEFQKWAVEESTKFIGR